MMVLGWLLLIFSVLFDEASSQIPSYIHVCGRRNPQLNDCIKKSILSLREKLKTGMPEIGVPPLEPLVIERVDIVDTPNLKLSVVNVTLYGSADMEVPEYSIDLEKKKIAFKFFYKVLTIDTIYDIDSKAIIPIKGTGPIHLEGEDAVVDIKMDYKLINRHGKKYFKATSITAHLDVKSHKASFNANEDGNKSVSEIVNHMLNQQEGGLVQMATGLIERAIGSKSLEITNQVTDHFTYDQLFPDRE